MSEWYKDVPLEGTCVDLESACRQLPVAPAHAPMVAFSLKNPRSGDVEYFESCALPFGAVAAVHGFNRAAQALEDILLGLFGIPRTHCFDNFSFIAPWPVASFIIDMVAKVLKLLGWSTKEAKQAGASVALGVEFDLSMLTGKDPKFVVNNKLDRIRGILDIIFPALEADKMSPAEAAGLRGRLVFAHSQTFGRLGALAFHYLGRKADQVERWDSLSEELRWSLAWWASRLSNAKPTEIPVAKHERPLLLFTNGSCESNPSRRFDLEAGYGGVPFDPVDGT